MRPGRPRRHGLVMGTDRLHVVVAGGGLAGLATALFLGRRGYQVTVVEPDALRASGGPRPGVPQARQPHNFLGRSVRVLRDEAPDVLDTLIPRGALRIPVDLGDGPPTRCCAPGGRWSRRSSARLSRPSPP